VNPDFVVHDRNGKIHAVRYDAVSAMLLDELLKEHRKVEEQEIIIADAKSNAAKQGAMIAELKSRMQALTAKVKEQASQIQRANATLGMSSLQPQLTGNNHQIAGPTIFR
jgi:predicted RNase H-like nuclease (RuvC/YqgF family)